MVKRTEGFEGIEMTRGFEEITSSQAKPKIAL